MCQALWSRDLPNKSYGGGLPCRPLKSKAFMGISQSSWDVSILVCWNCCLSSLVAKPIFTNIDLFITIDICFDSLYENTDKISSLTNQALKKLLTLAKFNIFSSLMVVSMQLYLGPLWPTLLCVIMCKCGLEFSILPLTLLIPGFCRVDFTGARA